MSKPSFENNVELLNEIIEKLESGQLTLDESIKEYEEAMKLIKASSELVEAAEGKLFKVTEDSIEEVALKKEQ